MQNFFKKSKAFTLAEIFVSMVILSILVSVSIAFFSKKKDVEREYFYYSAYQNIVKVVDTALEDSTAWASTGSCKKDDGSTYSCSLFNPSGASVICSVFSDYFNVVPIENVPFPCGRTTDEPEKGEKFALRLLNGMEFYFEDTKFESYDILQSSKWNAAQSTATLVWVDINGHGKGEDKKYYDIMPFYVTRAGRVIPGYGEVEYKRGYDFSPAEQDAAGNASLMSFDVIYTGKDDVKILASPHAVSFVEAACKSGYVPDDTKYCKNFDAIPDNGSHDNPEKSLDCEDSWADCKLRLVKKMRKNR